MAALLMDTCCGCVDLRKGCFIVGYLNLVPVELAHNISSDMSLTTIPGVRMVCYCLDLRPDSAGAKFLANKLVSVIAGILQFVIWVTALFAFIVQPEPLKQQIQSSPAGAIAGAVIIILVCIAFSVFLLIGLFKNRIWYVKIYLVYMMVVTVLLVISVVVNIFTQPARFGLSGFLSNVLTILINVLTYFIIRNYYLAVTSSNKQNQNYHQHQSPNRV